MKDKLHNIAVDLIDDPLAPMRTHMDEENLQELSDSIRKIGLIQPITIRKVDKRYEVVAGHRRLKACKLAGVVSILCLIKDMNEADADDLKIHENLFREDVNPVDEARFIAHLIEKYQYEPVDLAKKVNKSISYLKARYDLLSYPNYLIEAVENNNISLGAARWLFKIEDENVRREYTRFAVTGGITVKRAQAWHDSFTLRQLPRDPTEYKEPDESVEVEQIELQMPCVACGHDDSLDNLKMVYVHQECENALRGSR